jgi:hypothetical protein
MPSLDANGFVRLDNDEDHQARAAAITACQLCDDDGYRGTTVCDHIDHYAETTAGRAAVNAELERIRNRRKGATT